VSATPAAPGRLSNEARDAATATALELLGTYFANAPTWNIAHQEQLGAGTTEDENLRHAIRLRAALSAARQLDPLLHQIARRLSFRYTRLADESVGAVRGRLDVQRYVRARTRRDVPKRYPVHVLERRHGTPENILAVYAAAWVRRELLTVRARLVLPTGAPEIAEIQERTGALTRALHNPLLADAIRAAENLWLRGDLEILLDEVEARIEGGHIAAPEPYAELVAWVRGFGTNAEVAGGRVEWAFYDDRFDSRLFEIWLLERLAAALERALGLAPQRKPLWARNATPTYTWKLATSSIRIHFQWALSQMSKPVWVRTSTGRPLDGIPDITVLLTTSLRGEAAVIIDAKLRQRDSGPTEEIYKLLGYLYNRGPDNTARGAIVYYAPEGLVRDTLRTTKGGVVLQLGVDPFRGSRDDVAFDDLAGMLIASLDDLDPKAREVGGSLQGGEENIGQIQAKAVSDLLVRAEQLPVGSLAPFFNILEQTLPSVWDKLEPDVRTILVTAEYFGATAPEGADLSGPLLGICAAVERLLCDEGRIFCRLQQHLPDDLHKPMTLGAAIIIKQARKPKTPRDHAIREFLVGDKDVNGQKVLDLCGRLIELNEHRRAAAHTEVILKERWRHGHAAVFGTGDTSDAGILAQVVAAIG
jgi:hypothetical protein